VLRFDVFGTAMGIERVGGRWVPFLLGAEGKRRRAEFEIPGSLSEEELAGYLADLFHESATAAHPRVLRVG
jgi:hypothetical protein